MRKSQLRLLVWLRQICSATGSTRLTTLAKLRVAISALATGPTELLPPPTVVVGTIGTTSQAARVAVIPVAASRVLNDGMDILRIP